MHAEKQSVAVGIGLAAAYDRHVHFCHISRREEIELIAKAKERGLPVTCEVTPHHLFMDVSDYERMGSGLTCARCWARRMTSLRWEHLNSTVDCVATDHAPHFGRKALCHATSRRRRIGNGATADAHCCG